MYFADRLDAGQHLGARLQHLRHEPLVVLGLPRGGVPVAAQVAAMLDAPLDVALVRKLGLPFQPELAMGAIGEDGVRVLDERVLARAHVSEAEVAHVEARERAELARRLARYRDGRAPVPLDGRTAVIVDDGIATGSTARAACRVARARGAARIVLAVPVAPEGWERRVGDEADECVALDTPEPFWAVGQFYDDFSPTSDDEVVEWLTRLAAPPVAAATVGDGDDGPTTEAGDVDQEVEVHAGAVWLPGRLTVPEGAHGLVVFAHGSGSSRHSPRNREVAAALNRAGLATLLLDLLTVDEEDARANVFDVELLARRLLGATWWARTHPATAGLPIGFFGASTGAAAALWAATEPDAEVAAVVSRGGRPDLAATRLAEVTAPTLLIVGGHDDVVLELNRLALDAMHCERELAVVPGATHLFAEPGALDVVATRARDWFTRHLAPSARPVGVT
ncbi:MAG: phosphoribosyltransferase family protein [Actinomycetota bacterium]|nr:phosphoribosyltransferase family protein [Actinomycetota bacterium]